MFNCRTVFAIFLIATPLCVCSAGPVTIRPIAPTASYSASRANAINDHGAITGLFAQSAGGMPPSIAFVENGGLPQALGSGAIFHNSLGWDINDEGVVVGGLNNRAFSWSAGILTDLGDLGGSYTVARSINDNSEIVGQAVTAEGVAKAFLYTSGGMSALPTFQSHESAAAFDNNAENMIVGYVQTDAGRRAVAWEEGHVRSLGTLGGDSSTAWAINNTGHVVGWSRTVTGDTRAFVYHNDVIHELPSIYGYTESLAQGINRHGFICGWEAYGSAIEQARAVVWLPNGTALGLNELLSPEDSGAWTLHYASSINSRGQIVGTGTFNGEIRGYVLTIPTPATASLIGLWLIPTRKRR